MLIRPYVPEDLTELRRITVEGFEATAIDKRVEDQFGLLGGHDWRWRKARQIDDECTMNPSGVFVAELEGRVVGYITTLVDREAGKGRIPNLAVDASARDRGLGRQLIEHALDYFRREGLAFAMIETMGDNPVGQHLYPSCGFVEVARQIHYARKL